MKKRLVVEMLDVIQFAKPNIAHLDIRLTADEILRYKRRSTSRNYNLAFEPIRLISSGRLKREQVVQLMASWPDPGWHPFLIDVATRLFDIISPLGGVWYDVKRKPISIFPNVWTKPAIRGVVVKNGIALPCLVNPRSSLYIDALKLSFVARGVHELHVVDDAQANGPMIIDLGKHPITEKRDNRIYLPKESELMQLEQFESILKSFLEAVKLAGFNVQPNQFHTVADLFRKN